jgi:hypothetical protein
VLAPGAPWPNWEAINEKPKEKKPYRKPRPKSKPLALPSNGLDFFAEAREQIASGKAKRNPNYYRAKDKSN